jgi:hypothetical protein
MQTFIPSWRPPRGNASGGTAGVGSSETDPKRQGESKAMSSSSYTNAAPCPFCGHDSYDEEAWFTTGCVHLVTDWTDDPDDNGGGVLGETVCDADPLPAWELARALQSLRAAVMDEDDDRYYRKVEALKSVLPEDQTPSWWPAVCDAISDQADEPIGDSDRELGRMPTWIMLDLISDIPGIAVTSVEIGRGAPISTGNKFVWAENPEAARTVIKERLDAATTRVQQAIELLNQRNDQTA